MTNKTVNHWSHYCCDAKDLCGMWSIMMSESALTEHFSVIQVACILREETMSHLKGINPNQFPLEKYFPMARVICNAIFNSCKDYHERIADQASTSTERVLSLMKSDVFLKLIDDIKKESDEN